MSGLFSIEFLQFLLAGGMLSWICTVPEICLSLSNRKVCNPGYLPAKKKKGIITWFSKVSVKRPGQQLPGVHGLGKKVPCVQPPGKLLPCVQAPGKQVPEVQRFGKQLPCTCLVPRKTNDRYSAFKLTTVKCPASRQTTATCPESSNAI
jgi:hypothetical protein